MASDQLVKRVHDCAGVEGSQHTAEPAGQAQPGEELHAPSAIAWNRCSVTQHQPPAVASLLIGDQGEQTIGLSIGETQQREFLAPVEGGDDPRRPAAEPSPARIQQNRAWQG